MTSSCSRIWNQNLPFKESFPVRKKLKRVLDLEPKCRPLADSGELGRLKMSEAKTGDACLLLIYQIFHLTLVSTSMIYKFSPRVGIEIWTPLRRRPALRLLLLALASAGPAHPWCQFYMQKVVIE